MPISEHDLEKETKELKDQCEMIGDNLSDWIEEEDWLMADKEIRRTVECCTTVLFSIADKRRKRPCH